MSPPAGECPEFVDAGAALTLYRGQVLAELAAGNGWGLVMRRLLIVRDGIRRFGRLFGFRRDSRGFQARLSEN